MNTATISNQTGAAPLDAALFTAGTDVGFHDTYYVVLDIHSLLGIVLVFGVFAVLYIWFEKIFRVGYNKVFATMQLLVILLGVAFVHGPYFLARNAMPRTYAEFPKAIEFWSILSAIGSVLIVIGAAAFFLVLTEALVVKRPIRDRKSKPSR